MNNSTLAAQLPAAEHGPMIDRSMVPAWLQVETDENGCVLSVRVKAPDTRRASTKLTTMLARPEGKRQTYITNRKNLQTHYVEAMSAPFADTNRVHVSEVLETLPGNIAAAQRDEALLVWKLVAAMCGAYVRDSKAEPENQAIFLAAARHPAIVSRAVERLSQWPHEIQPIPAAKTEEMLAMLHLSGVRVSPRLKLQVVSDRASTPVDHGSVSPSAAAVPQATSAPTFFDAPKQPAGETPAGDKLSPAQADQLRLGMFPPRFSRNLQQMRAGAPWAVMMVVPQAKAKNSTHDLMIMTVSGSDRTTGPTACALSVGRPGAPISQGTEEVRIWKAAAACFGLIAKSNSTQPTEGYTHPRTRALIRQAGEKVLDAIRGWPMSGHEGLKPLALRRAQMVLDEAVPTTAPVEDRKDRRAPSPRRAAAPIAVTNPPRSRRARAAAMPGKLKQLLALAEEAHQQAQADLASSKKAVKKARELLQAEELSLKRAEEVFVQTMALVKQTRATQAA